jgi:hypothetical protein
VRIDHVLYAVAEFESAARHWWDAFGLAAVPGGKHQGWGTANWIVPLGDGYVELIGIDDPDVAAQSDLGRHVLSVLRDGERFIGWCVRPDLFDEAAERAGLEINEGSRVRPDGAVLRWRTAGVEVAMQDPSLPFFIDWQVPPELHPGRMQAAHRVAPQGIAWVEVLGDASALRSWLGDEDVPARVVEGPPALVAVGVGTASGEVMVR